MLLFDLTHLIAPTMPVYPGTEPPDLVAATTLEQEGFRETLLRFFSHTGTHMDAPAHMLSGAPSLDQLDINAFGGSAMRIDLTALVPGDVVSRAMLEERLAGKPRPDFLLLATGWDRFWGSADYFSPFPTLSPDAASYLATLPLKGVGVDVISVDPMGSVEYPVHKALLGAGMVIVENLRGLTALPSEDVTFLALPLLYLNADGAPVRAVAWKER